MSVSANNKRIAKNTVLLYARQILFTLVSLYTVRIVLDTLGVQDLGIYSVVCGIVSMFSFLSGAMATASQRFFSYALGEKDFEHLKNVFSLTVLVYFAIAAIVVLLAETVGLWILCNKLVIPADRMYAALWIYQFSILTTVISIMTTPYLSLLMSREHMSIYSIVSIFDVVMKLVAVFLLLIIPYDKMIVYGVLLCVMTLTSTYIYCSYCRKHFEESSFRFYWNKKMFKELLSFTSWFFFSMFSGTLQSQGISILFNLFFGPVVNSAQGIAGRIRAVTQTFAANFSTAVHSQIVKKFAAQEFSQMFVLLFRAGKTTYFLTLITITPIIANTEEILSLWLTEIPPHAVMFTRLLLIESLCESISYTLSSANQAGGKIKVYCIALGSTALLSLPFIYVSLKFGAPAETVYVITIITMIVLAGIRVYFLKNIPGFSLRRYAKSVLVPAALVTMTFPLIVYFVDFTTANSSIFVLGANMACQLILVCISVFLLGFSRDERGSVITMIRQKINNLSINPKK